MHSVWQVMRQEGLEVPRGRRVVSRRLVALLSVIAVIVLVAVVPGWFRRARPLPPPPGAASGPSDAFALQTEPA